MSVTAPVRRANHRNRFRAYGLRGMAELIDPFIGVDRAWLSAIGCRLPPHKYADVKQRLPRMARPVPFYRQ